MLESTRLTALETEVLSSLPKHHQCNKSSSPAHCLACGWPYCGVSGDFSLQSPLGHLASPPQGEFTNTDLEQKYFSTGLRPHKKISASNQMLVMSTCDPCSVALTHLDDTSFHKGLWISTINGNTCFLKISMNSTGLKNVCRVGPGLGPCDIRKPLYYKRSI